MGKKNTKIYHAAIYVRLSKKNGDVSSVVKVESNAVGIINHINQIQVTA